MKMYKKLISFIVLGFIIIYIGFIYIEYTTPQKNHKVFGVTYMTMNNPFYKIINNEILKIVEKNNDSLMTLDPALDIEKQNEQIYKFIENDVDGIFINPINFEAIEPALQAAKEANIPVIVIDAPVGNEQLAKCTIVSDNYNAGVACAKDMMKRMDKANIILLKHTTAKSAKDRIDGFIDVIKDNNQYKIINEAECEGQLEIAMPKLKQMLKETPDVDVIMALNDPSALGAVAALEKDNRNDVIVYGIDGTPDVKSMINNKSIIVGTVAQSPIKMGQIAGEKMYEVLSGHDIESNIIIPVYLITKENISNFDEKRWQ